MTFLNTPGTILSRSPDLSGPFSTPVLDRYGEPLAGTTSVAVLCEIQQRQSTEPGEAGEFSVATWDGFFPTGTTLDTGDAVFVAGKGTFEVVGEPADWNEGSTAVNYFHATLKRTAGAV